ncbi:hypothetical protein TNCV_3384641 [Trichonephila clavipes]|uniref:Uncharacterized protein n=1 Tax=Trichonephila clavipes TaxID=2585209 RepID=A0A8X6STI5_TRICX|nr:hypothetical protein TNCV_3384641 [Trichonephila clavipes]
MSSVSSLPPTHLGARERGTRPSEDFTLLGNCEKKPYAAGSLGTEPDLAGGSHTLCYAIDGNIRELMSFKSSGDLFDETSSDIEELNST